MTPKQRRAGIYLRVSQQDQKTDNQLLDLKRVAEQRGWVIVDTYVDHAVSGRRDSRPQLDRLRRDARQGKLDVIAAWSIDRLGRSLHHVVNLLAELTEEGVAVYLHQQQVDSTTSAGKAMLGMCAVFAEFEWNSTSDRIKAGIARARKEGKRIGRPTTVTDKIRRRILDLRRSTKPPMGILRIAREVGCGTSTVQKILAAEEA